MSTSAQRAAPRAPLRELLESSRVQAAPALASDCCSDSASVSTGATAHLDALGGSGSATSSPRSAQGELERQSSPWLPSKDMLDTTCAVKAPPGLCPPPNLAEPQLLSLGSALHGTGICKPCAWFWKPAGCVNGADCRHCHACPKGEIWSRRQAKLGALKEARAKHREEADQDQEVDGVTTAAISDSVPPPPAPGGDLQAAPAAAPEDRAPTDLAGPSRQTWAADAVAPFRAAPGLEDMVPPPGLSRPYQVGDRVAKEQLPVPALPPGVFTTPAPGAPILAPATLGVASTAPPTASLGSVLHGTGKCKPCVWFWTARGCNNGVECQHCHLCQRGEVKQRKKAKVAGLLDKPMPQTEVHSRIMDTVTMPYQQVMGAHAVAMPEVLAAHGDPLPVTRGDLPRPTAPVDMMPMYIHGGGLAQSLRMCAPSDLPDDGAARPLFPSAGSALHQAGACKPCAWFWKPQGCVNGKDCNHCHACPSDALKTRRRNKMTLAANKIEVP